MSQALYTSMSGIASATTELAVISNNVANINTTAFKKSSVNFSDVYSTTLSSGSVATSTSGGTNPIQVGVGAQVSSVSKDFSSGSATSTGLTTDLMIQGPSGFFTVQGTDGITYYTRSGNFAFDSGGNLVTPEGYQVLGTSNILNATTSTANVSIPLSICADVTGTPAATLSTETVSNLNGLGGKNITSGDFNIELTVGGVVYTATIQGLEQTNPNTTMSQLASYIQDGRAASAGPPVVTALTGLNASYTPAGGGTAVAITGIGVNVVNGAIQFDYSKVRINGGTAAAATNVAYNSTGLSDTTNFLTVTGLDSAPLASGKATSKMLDSTVSITELSSASEAISKTDVMINNDGSIQVTYDNGSVLSVQLGPNGADYEFVYTTVDGVQIEGTKCGVSDDVAEVSNFIIQMATVTNTDGLLAQGSNLYKTGPNSGDVVYTVAGQMGCGKVSSGYLESSNVDLSEELSNMILAQRAIQANSRVFTTTSNIMDVINQMGR